MADLLESLLPAEYIAPDVERVLEGELGGGCGKGGSGPVCSSPCKNLGIFT